MTAPNLADLRALDKAATPGPWHTDGPIWVDPPGSDGSKVETRSLVCSEDRTPVAEASAHARCDMDLIAAYRNATPALVAALTDVLALADQWRDRGHVPECTASYPPCERCAKAAGAAELRRAITNHVTPDAPGDRCG